MWGVAAWVNKSWKVVGANAFSASAKPWVKSVYPNPLSSLNEFDIVTATCRATSFDAASSHPNRSETRGHEDRSFHGRVAVSRPDPPICPVPDCRSRGPNTEPQRRIALPCAKAGRRGSRDGDRG